MSGPYEIRVTVQGVATEHQTSFGLRTDRETLASLVVPVPPGLAWDIFARALTAATASERPTVGERAATTDDRKAVVSDEGTSR